MDTPAAPSVRLFLALWPDAGVREALRATRDRWTWPRAASPVATDKLHVTLHFLGSQPADLLPALLDGLAAPFIPFPLRLDRAEMWHNGIATLVPTAPPQPLLDLHERLAQALVTLGLQPESRAYRPHVTMARRAGGAAAPALTDREVIEWDVRGYALVESRGGAYAVLRDYC